MEHRELEQVSGQSPQKGETAEYPFRRRRAQGQTAGWIGLAGAWGGYPFTAPSAPLPIPFVELSGPGWMVGSLYMVLGIIVARKGFRRLRTGFPAIVISGEGIRCHHLIGSREDWSVPWEAVIAAYPGRSSVALEVRSESLPTPRFRILGSLRRALSGASRSMVHIPTTCVAGGQHAILNAIREFAPNVSVWRNASWRVRRTVFRVLLDYVGL